MEESDTHTEPEEPSDPPPPEDIPEAAAAPPVPALSDSEDDADSDGVAPSSPQALPVRRARPQAVLESGEAVWLCVCPASDDRPKPMACAECLRCGAVRPAAAIPTLEPGEMYPGDELGRARAKGPRRAMKPPWLTANLKFGRDLKRAQKLDRERQEAELGLGAPSTDGDDSTKEDEKKKETKKETKT